MVLFPVFLQRFQDDIYIGSAMFMFSDIQRKALFLFIFLFGLPFLAGGENLLPQPLHELRQEGVSALMNMDYEGARSAFGKMIEVDPRHPAGYIYMAKTVWLGHLASLRRLQTSVYSKEDSFFAEEDDPADPEVDKEFHEFVDKGILLAEARLQADKKDTIAMYYLGAAKNMVAGYEATVRRSFISALKNGSKGVGVHRDLLKIDPQFVDAQMSIGMYNYVVGSLPLAVKILVFLGGVRGSRSKGLEMLEEVAAKGTYARDDASTLLVMLYNREDRLKDSLKILDQLLERHPGNHLFRLERAVTLSRLGQFAKSFQEFRSLLVNPAAYEYIPDLIHFQYASALTESKSWEPAAEHFLQAAAQDTAPSSVETIAHLEAGKCFDAAGKREQAMAQYELVLKRRDVFESRKKAEKYSKKPYKP